MANYNNYPYGGFNPYSFNQFGNNYQPNNFQQNNSQLNQYAFVNGIEGAKSFQVQPNQSILLMDSDNPICYMKQANAIGQATLRYFRLTEIKEDDVKNNASTQNNNNNIVLKADFEVLSKRLDDLSQKLEKSIKTANFKGNKVE